MSMDSVLPNSDIEETGRYGAVGKVPWTLAQTLVGTAATVVPWLLIVVLSQVETPPSGSAGRGQRLAPAVDIVSGIIFLLFTALVEGAFLIAPLLISIRGRTPGTSWWSALGPLGLRRTRF